MTGPAAALRGLREAVDGAGLALEVPGAERERPELVHRLDDDVLPRLDRLDAPLLTVVGGSTGAGRSTVANSLVGAAVTPSGVPRPTTRSPVLVCRPDDLARFADTRVLPGLRRTTGAGTDHATLQVVRPRRSRPGRRSWTRPAADLWLFVATAARYADAVPWDVLETAAARGTAPAVLLDRLPPGAEREIASHQREMLAAHGLGSTPRSAPGALDASAAVAGAADHLIGRRFPQLNRSIVECMFAAVEDLERFIAAAPDRPTPDELDELTPPALTPDDDRPDDARSIAPAPFDTEPSGWLALDLDSTTTDPRTLSDAQLVEAMAGFGRVATWAQARQSRVVAELERRRSGSASRYTPDEVALALSMSRFSATGLIERSRRLADTLHGTLSAFEAGRVDGFKVRLICDAVRYLDDAQAEWVQNQVLEMAPHQSVAQLRAALARAVIAVDPEGANLRHRRARKDRRVGIGQEQDGMATVWASLAAQDAQQVFGTLTGLARGLGAEDPRGMDARRADLLVGLMTGEISIAFPVPDGHVSGSSTPDHPTSGASTSDGGSSGGCVPESHAVLDGGGGGESGGASPAGQVRSSSTDDRGSGRENDTDRPDPAAGRTEPASGVADTRTRDSNAAHDSKAHGGAVWDSAGWDSAGWDGAAHGGAVSDDVADSGDDPDVATAAGSGAGACPVCTAQTWRAAHPQVRPVNPTKPLVQVLMAHSTLRGTDHAPAELVGYGAICAEQAREIAADSVWHRLVYDDLSGALLDHGRRTYRPPAALADHVRARDVHCRSPLCRRRAIDCELDHTDPFPHGPTAEPNLAAVCLLHHDEKHAPGWTVLQHPDGRIEWTTPTGHVYSSEVHDHRPPPPPPRPSVPGPIADRTGTSPEPTATSGRSRVRHDWASASGTGSADEDTAPF